MAYPGVNYDQLRTDFYRHLTLDVSSYLRTCISLCVLKIFSDACVCALQSLYQVLSTWSWTNGTAAKLWLLYIGNN